MSRIDELIAELCPNGVEYKKLGEVATIRRGGSFQKKDFCEDGVPCIHYGQIYTRYGLFADKTLTFISEDAAKKQKYAVKNDIVMAVTSENIDDVCKCVAWLGDDEIAVSGHTAIIHHTLNPKYLCYYFHTAMFYAQKKKLAHGTKVIEVTPDKLADITIPVPPMEVQSEIVKILDNFTELTAELTARKKQYEYYRDLLLDFDVHGGGTSECQRKTISDLFIIKRGKVISKDFIKDNVGDYPVYSSQTENNGELGRISTYDFEGEYLTWTTDGANAGSVFYRNEKFNITNVCGLLQNNSPDIITRFAYYVLILEAPKYVSKGMGNPKLMSNVMGRIKIPVPQIEEQERIVNILDRFDKLCNDISEGLPAEIEARRKQYEYYRDKMLSFNEA